MQLRSILAALVLLFVSMAGLAQPAVFVPPALAPWVPWVLEGHEHARCPLALGQEQGSASAHLCAWPGTLTLDVAADGAGFDITWTVLGESLLPLPGDARLRPQDVRIDGRSAAVLLNAGRPVLRVAPGRFRITGRLAWTQRPAQLPVPESIALVDLRLDGSAIALPERDGEQLWLGRVVNEVGADTLELRVFRRLADGLPPRLSTQLQLEVSGRAREATFASALPAGFVPVAIQSPLPAALLADGGLRVQLRPGTWTISVEARALELVDGAGPPLAQSPWPEQEIWSWQAAPALRVVEVSGGVPVDPTQVGAPWGEALPTAVLSRDQRLQIVERSRGKDADQPHRVRLRRELWLDFDGQGFTARDALHGRLAGSGRLNVTPPWSLQRASEAGGDLLITTDADGHAGVELRNPSLALQATNRHAGRGGMPASGWAVDVESMSAVLNLPPGWRLLAAVGVDSAPQSWLSQWTLLDLFLLAVAALLAFRLHGVGFAALVLAYLALAYHETSSPLWSLLAVIALGLLLALLSAGRLQMLLRITRRGVLALTFLLALPFVAEQLKLALHPQLERHAVEDSRRHRSSQLDFITVTGSRIAHESDDAADVEASFVEPSPRSNAAPPAAPPPPPPPPSMATDVSANQTDKGTAALSRHLNTYPDDAVLQAGPGTPDWRWQRPDLGWSGPVLASQTLDLWLSPPWLTRSLRVLAVVLLTALLLRLAGVTSLPRRWRQHGAAAALLALALGLPTGAPQAADFPPQALLDELRDRLLHAPACAPQCASLDAVEIVLDDDQLRLAMVLHAEADVAVPLPDPGKGAALRNAQLDGRELPLLQAHGQRWLALPRGVQRVQLTWKIGAADQIDLRFPMPPASVQARLDGWESSGLDGSRLLGDTLQLLRRRGEEQGGAAVDAGPSAQEFPPFVRVTRRLLLNLDWTVTTLVERVAPAQSGFSVTVPLIAGERLLDDRLDVVEGRVKLSFAANEYSQSWQSRLPVSDQLTLTMGPLRGASERWEVQVGAWWHAEFSGLPESSIVADDGVRRYDPRPGETLHVALSRPTAVAGSSLAFDQVTLVMQQGSRARDSSLRAELRSTRGGQHVVRIPADAELLSVLINGAPHALRVEDAQLRLPVLPGAQSVEISWRRPLESGIRQIGDAVDLGAPVANLRSELRIESDRWLLAAGGTGVGPAVLYWGQLLVMLLVAAGLARVGSNTPLRFHHWLLLGLGFSTVSWLAAFAVVAWLLLLGWRQRSAPWIVTQPAFALIQVLLGLVTMMALLVLVSAIPYGLLGSPDMQVQGNGSSAGQLLWFNDRSDGELPPVWAISLPLWTYKLAILLWAFWLANALIGWLRWAWQSLSAGGYWPPRKLRPAVPTGDRAAAPSTPAADAGSAEFAANPAAQDANHRVGEGAEGGGTSARE